MHVIYYYMLTICVLNTYYIIFILCIKNIVVCFYICTYNICMHVSLQADDIKYIFDIGIINFRMHFFIYRNLI